VLCSSGSVTEEDQRSVGIEEIDKVVAETLLWSWRELCDPVDPDSLFRALVMQGFCEVRDG
jgi:hypothetical protein